MTLVGSTQRATLALALGTALAAMPIALDLSLDQGLVTMTKAFAKNGSDDSGGDDNGGGKGGSGKGRDDSDDDSGGNGGKGSGDDSGGNGGKGGGGNGGKGGEDSDDDNSDGKGSDDRGRDDNGGGKDNDNNRGSDDKGGSGKGKGGDDKGHSGKGKDDSRRGKASAKAKTGVPQSSGGGLKVVKFEQSAGGFEVVYSNGVKEEIENGTYEMKNSAGRTVVERPATRKDIARITTNSRKSTVTSGRKTGSVETVPVPQGTKAEKIEIAGNSIEVSYSNGWKEEVAGGRYELKDPNNNTVVQRSATGNDRQRLLSLAGR